MMDSTEKEIFGLFFGTVCVSVLGMGKSGTGLMRGGNQKVGGCTRGTSVSGNSWGVRLSELWRSSEEGSTDSSSRSANARRLRILSLRNGGSNVPVGVCSRPSLCLYPEITANNNNYSNTCLFFLCFNYFKLSPPRWLTVACLSLVQWIWGSIPCKQRRFFRGGKGGQASLTFYQSTNKIKAVFILDFMSCMKISRLIKQEKFSNLYCWELVTESATDTDQIRNF